MGHEVFGVTMMARVPEGAIREAEAFYTRVIGRGPDFRPTDQIVEWKLTPGAYFLVGEGEPPQNGRIRFRVADIHAVRDLIQRELGVEVSDVVRVEGVVQFCNFTDPWGNEMGLFEGL